MTTLGQTQGCSRALKGSDSSRCDGKMNGTVDARVMTLQLIAAIERGEHFCFASKCVTEL
jgi:hypothetical protein